MSGRRRRTRATASSPDAASPTTSTAAWPRPSGVEGGAQLQLQEVDVGGLSSRGKPQAGELIARADLEVSRQVPRGRDDGLGSGAVEEGAGAQVHVRPEPGPGGHGIHGLEVGEGIAPGRDLGVADLEGRAHVLVEELGLDPAAPAGLRVPLHPAGPRAALQRAIGMAEGLERQGSRVNSAEVPAPVGEEIPVAHCVQGRHVGAGKEAELGTKVPADPESLQTVGQPPLGAALEAAVQEAATQAGRVRGVRVVPGSRPLEGEVLVATEAKEAVGSDGDVVTIAAHPARRHHAHRGVGIEDAAAQPQHSEILGGRRIEGVGLHVEGAHVPGADTTHEASATEDGHGPVVVGEADATRVEQLARRRCS